MARPLALLLGALCLAALPGCDAAEADLLSGEEPLTDTSEETAHARLARAEGALPYDAYVGFVVIGHSNTKGHGSATQSPVIGPGEAFDFSTFDSLLHPLNDPVGFVEPDPKVYDCSLGTGARTPCHQAKDGSMWPAFVQAFSAATGQGVVLTARGRGGSRLLKELTENGFGWHPSTRYDRPGNINFFGEAVESTAEMMAAMATLPDVTTTLGGWVVMLGFTDAGDCFDRRPQCQPEHVVAGWVDFLDAYGTDVQAKYGGRVYLIKDGSVKGGLPGYFGVFSEAIRGGMVDACEAHPHCEVATEIASDLSFVTEPNYFLADGFHFNQRGLNLIGTEAGEGVAVHFPRAPFSARPSGARSPHVPRP